MSFEYQTVDLGGGGGIALASPESRGVSLGPDMAGAFAAAGSAEGQLDRLLHDPDARCITTGQQPGLLTGPLYTIHKALSAVALAKHCEKTTGRPVVPVFWVAGDDHDFVESNHCHLVAQSGELETLKLRERRAEEDSTPMYREVLGDDIEAVHARLPEILPDSEFTAHYLEWIKRHYRPDQTLADAFGDALAELLGPYGLVVFRPTSEPAKRQMRPFLKTALERAQQLTDGLMDRAAQLETQGTAAPVAVKAGETLVMMEASAGRDRLLYNGGSFHTRRSHEEIPLNDLRELVDREPQRFSPNVLLRPVVEAAVLPTLAYVAGPGERRYLAQTNPLYDILEVTPQAVVTRWGGRVIEARVRKTLDRYDLKPEDLNAQPGQPEGRLAGEDMPEDAATALETLRTELKVQYERLADAAQKIDPTMRKPVEGAMHRAEKDVAGVEKRLVGQLKQKNATLIRQIGAARTALYPDGKEQERMLNVLQFLTRYGDAALEGVMTACETWVASAASD